MKKLLALATLALALIIPAQAQVTEHLRTTIGGNTLELHIEPSNSWYAGSALETSLTYNVYKKYSIGGYTYYDWVATVWADRRFSSGSTSGTSDYSYIGSNVSFTPYAWSTVLYMNDLDPGTYVVEITDSTSGYSFTYPTFKGSWTYILNCTSGGNYVDIWSYLL